MTTEYKAGDTYTFPCGCTFKILGPNPKGGIPLLDIDNKFFHYGIPYGCPKTWKLFEEGLTIGVFQLEKSLGRHWSKQVKPKTPSHLGALAAVLRPGCLESRIDGKSMTQIYADRKNGLSPTPPFEPHVDKILKDTFGTLVFQEQAMLIAQQIAGFDLREADALRKCVTGDTMFVSKSRGWISINELLKTGYEKDLFLVMDELGNQQWKKIKNIWSTGKHNVREVESGTGFCVKATKYHQFLTVDGWKARRRLKLDDNLICARYVEYTGRDRISRDLAIVIAGIVTEGYFSNKTKSGKKTTSHFTNFNKKNMKLYCDAYKRVFGHSPNMEPGDKVARISVEDRNYLNKFMDYGWADTKKIPQVMMGMTKETTREFLSFMLTAEGGCINNSKGFQFSSKSEFFVNQVKLLLLRFGIRSNKYQKYNKNYQCFYHYLDINHLEDQKKLVSELSVHLEKEKLDLLKQFIACKSEKNFSTDIVPAKIVKKMIDQYPYVFNYYSGSAYKNKLTRSNFKKFADKLEDKYYQQIADGHHQYDAVYSLNTEHRQQETYDFTIDEDTPYIIANGMVIHNCIGKKLPEEMAKVKVMFLEGAKKAGIVSDAMAEQIFGWIEKSQRYAFNLSHAICYGINGFWSAYLKVHFPVYFFTSYLKHAKNKQDTYDEIKRLVEDAKMFNIKVLPPDIRSEETEFYTNGRDVCFGLVDVKGIGAGTFEKARETIGAGEALLGKSVSDMNWFEFLCFIGYDVKKTIVESAIRAGAMDCFNEPRQQMLFDYSCISELTAKEIALLRTKLLESPESLGSMTLVEALRIAAPTKKEGGIAHSVTRKQKILDAINLLENPPRKLVDTAFSRNKDEQEMLGIGLTACAVDSCSRELANASCKDILLCRGDELIVAVEIANVRQFLTKVKKEKMAYLTVTDETGTADNVVVFPSAFVDCSDMLYQGNTVMLFGYCQTERNSFVAERCIQI